MCGYLHWDTSSGSGLYIPSQHTVVLSQSVSSFFKYCNIGIFALVFIAKLCGVYGIMLSVFME